MSGASGARTPATVEAPAEVPTFHEFASEWLAAREPELAAKTVKDYRRALTDHLLPYFAKHRLTEITAEEVDRYKTTKAREGRIAPAQINKMLKRLAQILELAVDYGHLPRNPAASKGGRRRLKESKPQRSWVEPEQLMALLATPRPLGTGRYLPPWPAPGSEWARRARSTGAT